MSVKSVGLFCAASEAISSLYVEQAREVGSLLGYMGLTLVYGGASAGLMEATAAAAKEAGAHIIGVVPKLLVVRNRVSSLLDERIVTENLSDRKDNILKHSDILVALPGGIGTLDEIFHVMAAATLDYHGKPVVLYNASGFWNSMIAMLHEFEQSNFVRCDLQSLLLVANSNEELAKILEER